MTRGCHQNQLEKTIKNFLREVFCERNQQLGQKQTGTIYKLKSAVGPHQLQAGSELRNSSGPRMSMNVSSSVMATIVMEHSFLEGRAKSFGGHRTKGSGLGIDKIFFIPRMASTTMSTFQDIKIATAAICGILIFPSKLLGKIVCITHGKIW